MNFKQSTMETSTNSYQTPEKKTPVVLILLVILLALAVAVLGYKYYTETQRLKESSAEKEILSDVKSDLEKQLRDMVVEYDSLKTNNDSINTLMVGQQDKIKQLLRYQASDAEKIKKYREELETLRNVMRSYIVQIDSLNTRNRSLSEENIQVHQKLSAAETQNTQLSKEKEMLGTQVQLAKVLSAKNVKVVTLNKRENDAEGKIKKITKISVGFTVRENAVAEPGKKVIYLRLLNPDNVSLANAAGDMFTYNGENIVYSEKRDIEYENKDIDVVIYWTKTEDLKPGDYTAVLYAEGYEIGSASFTLK
jgi:predicted RNase H-like nuclease (RuvC/YqgF family)